MVDFLYPDHIQRIDTHMDIAVQIAEPESEPQADEDSQHIKQFPAGLRRRLSGKHASPQLPHSSSRSSLSEASPAPRPAEDGPQPSTASHNPQPHNQRRQYYSEKLLAQVGDWLEHERKKSSGRRRKHGRRKSKSPPKSEHGKQETGQSEDGQPQNEAGRPRSDSVDSQSSDVSFDRLQHILEESMAHMGLSHLPHFSPRLSRRARKVPSRSSLHRAASSDTDYVDGDVVVPGCDAWLDNSKTMSYSGGGADPEANPEDLPSPSGKKAEKEKEAWITFKNEIIKIVHTLRLKGWRRVPLGAGSSLSVERLSGALTNAVYVVSPPTDLPDGETKRLPPKLLLRIYGAQAESLIDRDNELQVLKRLARKKIGPRLLGTFQNGRFEQFFNANPLTPADLRETDVMKQIAKRMRELHDGIDLLQHERDGGSSSLKSFDAWADNAERIATFLDKQYESSTDDFPRDSIVHAWKADGYVCGAPWPLFKKTVLKYRTYLESFYNGQQEINDMLVFAHSDVRMIVHELRFSLTFFQAQYGNILRVRPDDEKSPLLQPANQHKQLIVIDFEYAGPNPPGIEFANHFNEWTYNYHDATAPHACNARRYPTPDQQRLFLKAYVNHRPKFPSNDKPTPRIAPADSNASSGVSTPAATTPGLTGSTTSIADFMLDARVPPGGWTAAERAQDEKCEQRVAELMEQTRLWRPANHTFWITWGIVQAQVPNIDDKAPKEEDISSEEFDYLRYTQERAMFFWGDCVQMGLVKMEELPEKLRGQLKVVEF